MDKKLSSTLLDYSIKKSKFSENLDNIDFVVDDSQRSSHSCEKIGEKKNSCDDAGSSTTSQNFLKDEMDNNSGNLNNTEE